MTRETPDILPSADLFEALSAGRFDAIIDVRSPAEFAEDHVPGAINLPVLDNAERARVGAIYVQQSKFLARKIGAALVARNIAKHLETALAEHIGGWRPLVMCWRGGRRSGAMSLVLREVGWPATALEGGYRSYRRRVADALYEGDAPWRPVLIDGGTGAGKTALLRRLEQRGRAALDLEALAAHRGSLFGAEPARPQPSQKMFESLLFAARPREGAAVTAMEAEAYRIGDRTIPPALWSAMRNAPRIVLDAPVQARAAHLLQEYRALAEDRAKLDAMILRLPQRHSRAQIEDWRRMAAEGALQTLAEGLIAAHYDPSYAKSEKQRPRRVLARIRMERIDAAGLDAAAAQAEAAIDAYAAETPPFTEEAAPSRAPAAPPSHS